MTLGQATLYTPTKGIYFVKTRFTPSYGRGELVLEHNVFDAAVKGLDMSHKDWECEDVEIVHGPDTFYFSVEKDDDHVMFVFKEGRQK